MRPQLEEQRQRLEMPPGQWTDYDIAIMDLRGPLTSMLVASSLLLENEQNNLTEAQLHLAGLIMSSGQSLLARIENLIAHDPEPAVAEAAAAEPRGAEPVKKKRATPAGTSGAKPAPGTKPTAKRKSKTSRDGA
jgi:hypothetical protein